MRIDGPQDLITLCVSRFDGILPSSSPTPTPKASACTSPTESCINAEYTYTIGRRTLCRAPDSYIPEEALPASVCPHRRWNAIEAQSAQGSCLSFSPVPQSVLRMTGGTRRERRVYRLQKWASAWLEAHLSHPEVGYAALVLLRDLDDNVSMERIGELMYNDYLRLEDK